MTTIESQFTGAGAGSSSLDAQTGFGAGADTKTLGGLDALLAQPAFTFAGANAPTQRVAEKTSEPEPVVININIDISSDKPHPDEPHTDRQIFLERDSIAKSPHAHCVETANGFSCISVKDPTWKEAIYEKVASEFWYLSDAEQSSIAEQKILQKLQELDRASQQLIEDNPEIF